MAPDGPNVTILVTVVRLLPSALMPRSLVRVVKIMLPDGSNVTILVTVVRLWLSRSPGGFKATILVASHNWPLHRHNCMETIALHMS